MLKNANVILWRSCLGVVVCVGGSLAFGQTVLPAFSGPDTNAFLSVDINGGPSSSTSSQSASPTEGWNQLYDTTSNPTQDQFGSDQYGQTWGPTGAPSVTWSPWGGPTNTFGDGTQLPNDQGGLNVGAVFINKTFSGLPTSSIASGSVTASVIAAGTFAQYNDGRGQGDPIDSRDRGDGWTGGLTGPQYDIDMFRDFIFATGNGANVQSTNFFQLQLSGLNPNSTYKVSLYGYDGTSGAHNEAFTATPPITNGSVAVGWWAPETGGVGNETFTAPADEQVSTYSSDGTPSAPAQFTVVANGQGIANVWMWGGTGNNGDENADTTYLNGFQISGGTHLLLGDTNGDGKVDATDLATVLANMGQSFTSSSTFTNPDSTQLTTQIYSRGYAIGDFNGDGVVNGDDLSLFDLGLAQYNLMTYGSVPEPACLALLAVIPMCARRGRVR